MLIVMIIIPIKITIFDVTVLGDNRTLLGTARILCFQNEEMTFKRPLVASYDHDWPD